MSVSSQKVSQRDTLKAYDITALSSILGLGLRHEAQISLSGKVQNSLLAAQAKLIDPGYDVCPKCGYKLTKMGYQLSNFHAVFTDHKVRIQKHKCRNPECDWQSTPTTTSVFGTSIHPDLAKLQCEQGALYRYRDAQSNLEKLTVHHRSVNNQNKVKLMTTQVGAVLAQENLKLPAAEDCALPAQEAIIQIDGEYIPTKDKDKRIFEALSAVVYRPESICTIDQNHREIESKSYVLSAQDDDLSTMKTYLLHAALKQGMTQNTVVTALANRAFNCGSVIMSLSPYCKQLICILDWFHIAKKFQNVRSTVDEAFTKTLDRVKGPLWQGRPEEALSRLNILMMNVADANQRKKLEDLHDYLNRNRAYLVDYRGRDQQGKTYISQVAESHVESIIHARHKKSGKMQWTWEGAHNVLQMRGENC